MHRYAALALVLVSLTGALAWGQWRARDMVLAQAAQQTLNLARALAAQAARTLDTVALTLEVSADEFQASDPRARAPRAGAQRLAYRTIGRPELWSIRLHDAQGALLLDSRNDPGASRDPIDPALWQALRDAEPGQTLLGRPTIAAGQQPLVPVARRLDTPAAAFDGALVGLVPLTTLERLMSAARLPPGATVSLVTDTGTVLARLPALDGLVGRDLSRSPLLAQLPARAGEGTQTHVSRIDGVTRLYSYARVGGYPLLLVVAFSREQLLSDWRDNALSTGAVALAALAAAALAGVALLREVARRAASERELAAAKEAAEAASAAKSRFLAVMSHEIRTPLTGVIGLADLMLARERDARRLHDLRLLRRSAESLKTLLSDLLDFAKIEAGKLELESVEFSPGAIVREAVELFAAQADERGNTIRIELQAVPGAVRADPTRLRQVLLNLIGNAVKFTENGSIDVLAWAQVDAEAGDAAHAGKGGATRLHFRVRDTGPGLSEQARQALYGAFAQGDSSITRKFGGTGLGLAICRALVEAMGGRIDARNRPGGGADFCFHVTVAPAASAAAGADAAAVAQAGTGSPGSPRTPPSEAAQATPPTAHAMCCGRLLLAEDNPINRRLVAAMLEAAGHVVDVAEDGAHALRALDETDYDAVLMDAHMPVLDGIAATRRLRALPDARARTPVVLLSADLALFTDPMIAGLFDAAVAKPVEWPTLNEALERLLARSASRMMPLDADGPQAAGATAADPPGSCDVPGPPAGPERLEATLTAGTAPLVDRAHLARSRAALAEQLDSLVAQLPSHIEQLMRRVLHAGQHGTPVEVREAAHALGGAASMFGCVRLARAAQAVCRDPSEAALEALTEAAADTLVELGAWMREQARAAGRAQTEEAG